MTAVSMLHALHGFLAQFRFNYASESDLQQGISQALAVYAHRVEREFQLGDLGRLDFLIDGQIVIETKIGGSAAELMRQVSRYAQSDSITGILVITDRANHRLPQAFNGKPVRVLSLLDGAF